MAISVVRAALAPAPPADEDIRLPKLLNALYRPVLLGEEWRLAHDDLGQQDISAEAAAARMAELVPGLPDLLFAIEGLLSEVTELLTAAARSW